MRRSGSFVGIIILLALLGFGAQDGTTWDPGSTSGTTTTATSSTFGMPEHDNDQQVLNAQIPANAAIDIENPRGDVSVTAGDGPNVEVQAHEVALRQLGRRSEEDLRLRSGAADRERQRCAGQVRQQQQRPREPDGDRSQDCKVTVNAGKAM